MNKLVLKNPILKFKLGKIIKAQFGNMLRKHKYDVMAAIAGANAFNPFGTAILSYVVPKATLKAFKKDLPSTTSYPDGAYFEEKGPDGQVKKGRWQGGKKVYLTVTPTRTNLQAKTSKNITTTNLYSSKKPYFQSKYSNRANEIGADKIIEWQRKIGTNPDGIWGADTERKYLDWLNSNNIEEREDNNLNEETSRALENLARYLGAYNRINEWQWSPLEYIAIMDKKYGKPTIRPTQPTVTLYDRSGTRDWITTKLGHNPYEYTGAQRRALRYWLNGDKEGLNYDKNLLGVFGNLSLYAKQGAKFVSKNPVERFKRNFRKVAQ